MNMRTWATPAALILLLVTKSIAFEPVWTRDFGSIDVYAPKAGPVRSLILMVSGDGGWERTVVHVADILSKQGHLVVGIDIRQYFDHLSNEKPDCACPACDLSSLGEWIQRRYGLNQEIGPILIGYSSGATLVYAAAAEARPGSYRAVFSFGFCPDLEWRHPFCKGEGLESTTGSKAKSVIFSPDGGMQTPWFAYQGETDQVCNPAITEEFVRRVAGGKYVPLPRVGHGFAVLRHWLDQFETDLNHVIEQQPEGAPNGIS